MSGTIDTTGVTDVFATTNRMEDAGGGCIRIYNCVTKEGRLIAVGNSVVIPASCAIQLVLTVQDFARRIAVNMVEGWPVH